MSAYAILDVDIQDPEKYKLYMNGAQQLISAAGGRYTIIRKIRMHDELSKN